MRCERLTLLSGADPAPPAERMRSAVAADPGLTARVGEIVEAVARRGDDAVRELAAEHDGLAPGQALEVARAELDAALAALNGDVRAALELASANVAEVARTAVASSPISLKLAQGQSIALREIPVHRAGIYVPGGRAPYPSTVVMGVVTARVAGVEEVVVCAPGAHPTILAACALSGADRVYRVGGAQAVAAMALGTASIPAVDVIAGPGNAWVQEAKLLLAGRVGIDGFQGPSDVVVLATAPARAEPVALDLLAQAEHGPGTLVALVTDDGALATAVGDRLAAAPDTGAAAFVVEVADPEGGLALAEALAPEHLELQGTDAEALAPRVTRAGCLFVGEASATAFGDYVAGSNHSLPTGGSARFASALSPRTFRRRMAEVRIGPAAAELAPAGAALARAEGFTAHAESMLARVRENPSA